MQNTYKLILQIYVRVSFCAMDRARKQGMAHLEPISAENILQMQEQLELEWKLRENKTVLNGKIAVDNVTDGDSLKEPNLEYEFIYSIKDDDEGDTFKYDFKAYPMVKQFLDSLDVGVMKLDETVDETYQTKSAFQKRSVSSNIKASVTFEDNVKDNEEPRAKSAVILKSGSSDNQDNVRPVSANVLYHRKLDGKTVRKIPKTAPSQKRKTLEVSLSTKSHHPEQRHSSTESNPNVDVRKKESTVSMGKINDVTFQRKPSTGSKTSMTMIPEHLRRRKSVSYDPALEKASAYLHGGGKNFSRSNVYTSQPPVKYGLKHLQMNYTQNNLENNQSIIFLDLLRSSTQRSRIRGAEINHIERRLELQRNNPLYSTSFYEHKNIPDPFRRQAKKCARTVAQKKQERKEKIKKMTDEIHTGYVPTFLTMKIADKDEIEDIGKNCRYLRSQTPRAPSARD